MTHRHDSPPHDICHRTARAISSRYQLVLSARAISSRSSARLIALSVPRQLDSTASAEPRHAHHLSTPRDSTHTARPKSARPKPAHAVSSRPDSSLRLCLPHHMSPRSPPLLDPTARLDSARVGLLAWTVRLRCTRSAARHVCGLLLPQVFHCLPLAQIASSSAGCAPHARQLASPAHRQLATPLALPARLASPGHHATLTCDERYSQYSQKYSQTPSFSKVNQD